MDKKIIYIGSVIIAAGLIAYAFWPKSAVTPAPQTNTNQTSASNPSQAPATTTNPSTTPTPPAKTTPKKLSYGEAINTYKLRFQFSMCHSNPGSISVPKNTPVMLDNRDNQSRTIKVGTQTVHVAALDYELLYPAVTGDFNVTCDGGGAGTLHVEK